MKRRTLIGVADSSPLIQQVRKKEQARLRIWIKSQNPKSPRYTWCEVIFKDPALVSRVRLCITKGSPIAIVGNVSKDGSFITAITMLTMSK